MDKVLNDGWNTRESYWCLRITRQIRSYCIIIYWHRQRIASFATRAQPSPTLGSLPAPASVSVEERIAPAQELDIPAISTESSPSRPIRCPSAPDQVDGAERHSTIMHWLALLLLAVCAYYFVRYWSQLYLNYRIVRKTGLPYLISPVNTVSAPWIILGPLLMGPMERYLPNWLWEPLSYTIYGWEFRTGWAPHAKHGPVFMMATANHPELFIADPDVVYDMLRRPKDFPLSDIGNMIMGKFGDNLIIAKYKEWERMRKFIAPLINERVSSTVFQETKNQAEQLTQHLDSMGGVTDDSAENLKKIAVNVLGAAGYGKSRTWSAGAEYDDDKPPAGFHVTYLQAMRYLMDNMLAMAFVPTKLLTMPFMGQSLNNTAHAIHELPALTRKLLDEGRHTPGTGGRANIAQLLVQEQDAAEKGAITLHEDEIVGNLFVFSAAGTDTTANTMAYALFTLAADPKWQDWIIEEIDQVLAGKGKELEYNDVHPKLIRTVALMVCCRLSTRCFLLI